MPSAHQNAVPHEVDVILTLTGGLAAALLCGLVAQRLRIAPVVGYLLAGVLIGPFTPGFVGERGVAEQFAEIGVILLMFGVGLHFRVRELAAVGRVAVPGAIVQSAFATLAGLVVAHFLGWSIRAGLVFGLSLAVASTVVLLRALGDRDALHTPAGHVAVGWLIAEDLFTVVVLVVLPIFANEGTPLGIGALARAIAVALAKVGALVLFTFAVGRRAIPWLLTWIARTRSRELFTLAVLAIALGIAVGAALLFGASLALGAFLAGIVVGQSNFGARAAADALPMRDAFAVLFFVATGMMFDPASLTSQPLITLATLAIILVVKPITALLVVLLMRKPARTAMTVAVGLAQIGEFSFILAGLGVRLGILPNSAIQPIVAGALVSIALNPLLYGAIDPVTRWLDARRRVAPAVSGEKEETRPRVVVVGYGPVGRMVTRLLREQGFAPTIIELDPDVVRMLRARGVDVVHGDAGTAPVLEAAGTRSAQSLVFTSSAPAGETVRAAKDLNEKLVVITRAAYLREVPEIVRGGADGVVTAEAEVALAMAERLLRNVGASDALIDQTRERVREEFIGPSLIVGGPRPSSA
jgi:CPA2 family monovalent cation:H+ antiporter-2